MAAIAHPLNTPEYILYRENRFKTIINEFMAEADSSRKLRLSIVDRFTPGNRVADSYMDTAVNALQNLAESWEGVSTRMLATLNEMRAIPFDTEWPGTGVDVAWLPSSEWGFYLKARKLGARFEVEVARAEWMGKVETWLLKDNTQFLQDMEDYYQSVRSNDPSDYENTSFSSGPSTSSSSPVFRPRQASHNASWESTATSPTFLPRRALMDARVSRVSRGARHT